MPSLKRVMRIHLMENLES